MYLIAKIEHLCYASVVNRFEKLLTIAEQTSFEVDSREPIQPCGHRPSELRHRYGAGPEIRYGERRLPVHLAAAPGGRRVRLLKSMLTTACERDCYYCPFRAGRRARRFSFTPEEMARTFEEVHRRGAVDGLFLSTGILRGGANTQNRLLDTAEILRTQLGYRGYLHLKVMPGAEHDQVLRAMQLADRVSINLEAPNGDRLARLAPNKQFLEELLEPLQWATEIRRNRPAAEAWSGRWASTTTQFVVGAAGESDVELLHTTAGLYRSNGLRRAYFEAFEPVADTPLEDLAAEDKRREHRLYQASFLLRDYAYDLEDLVFDADGRLPLNLDPKRAAADRTLREAPLELNRAQREALMRVPGIGPRGAAAILRYRNKGTLRDLRQLRGLGIHAERAAPYVLLDGRRPPQQLPLFA